MILTPSVIWLFLHISYSCISSTPTLTGIPNPIARANWDVSTPFNGFVSMSTTFLAVLTYSTTMSPSCTWSLTK
uniref:Uncharacterized protein n=1 Tax=Ustilago hordei TaxID=120017 RepID=Q2A752_USTHO|nr:hypothetical protein UHO_0198 [Ustilago hordei]